MPVTNLAEFRPRAVVFDLDGTLTDNMPLHAEAFAVFAERHGLPPLTLADRRKLDGKRNSEIFPVLFNRAMTDDEWRAMEHEKETLYREGSVGRLRPLEGLVELLAAMDTRGIVPVVATSSPKENVQHTLTEIGLPRLLHSVARGDQVPRGKAVPRRVPRGGPPGRCAPRAMPRLRGRAHGSRGGRPRRHAVRRGVDVLRSRDVRRPRDAARRRSCETSRTSWRVSGAGWWRRGWLGAGDRRLAASRPRHAARRRLKPAPYRVRWRSGSLTLPPDARPRRRASVTSVHITCWRAQWRRKRLQWLTRWVKLRPWPSLVFLFLTELLGLPVFDTRQRRIGRVKDAAIVPRVDRDRVDRYLVGGGWAWLTVRHDQVRSIGLDGLFLQDEQLTPYHNDEYMLRLVRDLLDQQIIDAHGRKVVRVTDLTFEVRQRRRT